MSAGSSHGTAPSAGTPRSLDILLRDLEKRFGRSADGEYAKNFKNRSYATSLDDLDSNDDGKPALPYVVGATFVARRHEPPAPFGFGYDTPWPPYKTNDFRLPQIDYCLIRQPLEGRTLDESRVLTITGTIRTGCSFGAQVVVVNGNIVAKIYDPLYDAGGDCYDNKRDVVWLADGDYSRETAAYEELLASSDTLSLVPEYYGSWTIEVPTKVGDQTFTRHVRLILVQHIKGTVMSTVQPQLLSRQTRSAIMKKILEAESLIFNAGVLHRDISPRNIMLVPLASNVSLDDPHLRVVIIDFNVSNVIRLSNASCHASDDPSPVSLQRKWPGKLLGPVTRFWNAMEEFEARDWVNDEDGKANEWLWECFGQREEYVPLVRDREESELCPRIAWRSELEDHENDEDETVAGTVRSLDTWGDGDAHTTECPLGWGPENWKTFSKPSLCLSHRLVKGRAVGDDLKTLTITAVVRTRYDYGAQFIVMNNDMVAKTYDPLYQNEGHEYGLKDVVFDAYFDYSRKAAACHILQKASAVQQATPKSC